ncbi:MAG: TonB-dependent receptor plug domain-containing protein, partial [Treponema sp.]|nr:TonB-dependent receptor plug domain-containing protein [Treponema sp.]
MLFIALIPLYARDVEILVEDTELGLPLEGAVIRSWDGSQHSCDKNGTAVISVPDDRQVAVQAAYPGYENGRLFITPGSSSFVLGLRLSGIMESRELVIEAERPGSSETRTGRSVAVSGREIAQTAEIGIVEDVMNAVKLLPGVGYAGFFNAQPSIRGGRPGDMSASLDGYYIMNPYFWGGGFSIFDPRMVQSAQLSHGVFSTRYGHTVSGLLDITSKNPSLTETEFEFGASTSSANFNLSFPFSGRGGVLFMGRVTYYDPVVALAQQLSKVIDNEQFDTINSIREAPYIRSGTVTGSYRLSDNLELKATGFWGMDGIGVTYKNEPVRDGELTTSSATVFDWANYQGFVTAGLSWNPRPDMLLKVSAGTGYEDAEIDGVSQSSVRKNAFSDDFYASYPEMQPYTPSPYNIEQLITESDVMFNAQGRADYDWELGNGFLAAAGVQEMFTRYSMKGSQQAFYELRFANLKQEDQDLLAALLELSKIDVSGKFLDDLRISTPVRFSPDTGNSLFTTSGYGLAEYGTPGGRFAAELGLRVDHYYLLGNGFSLRTKPALNPRLNIDFNAFKNRGFIESLDFSAGTGLFTSIDNTVFMAEKQYNITEAKPNRAWTSVLGTRFAFPEGLNLNIEGYYKYLYDRMYIPVSFGLDDVDIRPQFDGVGKIWGIDMMLQKLQSRYWDGWLAYSFSWARYRDPSSGSANMGISGGTRGDGWYFPGYHRFHNINLVFNIRPAPRFN